MSLEERIQQSVQAALADLRARVDADIRSMVEQLLTAAADERNEAVDNTRRAVLEEAARETEEKVAETEARVRATVDELVENARSKERELAAIDVRKTIEAEAEQKLQDALASTREEMRLALANAENRAAIDVRKLVEAEAEQKLQDVLASTREEMRLALANAENRAAIDVRKLVEAEAEQKLQDVLASTREEMRLALENAENRASQEVRDSVTAARVRERENEMAGVSRLLESIRGLDGAASLSEVLDALAQAAGREASRAAVLVLRNDRLLGWKLTGFGPRDTQPKLIDLSLAEAGVAGLAVGSARPVTTRETQSATEGTGFAHLPEDRMGLAVPVIVGGRVVAVVYADNVTNDGREQVVPSSWPEVIEILARHAARCLEAVTVQKAATHTPSPRFWVPPGKNAPQQTSDAGKPADTPAKTA
jgi:chemotaxis protein histidine kinase CheA